MSGERGRGDVSTADALVIASYDSRDDRIVHLLTDSPMGRVPALARRARRSPRQFGGHLQLLNRCEVELTLREGDELAVVRSAQSTHGFGVVKGDLTRLALASVMAEVVTHLVPPHYHEPGVFLLLLRALSRLDDPAHAPHEDLLALFELRSLQLGGTLPDVDEWPGLPEAGREVLVDWLADRWRPLPAAVRRQTIGFLEQAVMETSGRNLKARAFLDEMLAG